MQSKKMYMNVQKERWIYIFLLFPLFNNPLSLTVFCLFYTFFSLLEFQFLNLSTYHMSSCLSMRFKVTILKLERGDMKMGDSLLFPVCVIDVGLYMLLSYKKMEPGLKQICRRSKLKSIRFYISYSILHHACTLYKPLWTTCDTNTCSYSNLHTQSL